MSDPTRYGIVELDHEDKVISVEEKPDHPRSRWAITGLYFFDELAVERSKTIKPSKRGELEITSLIDLYLVDGSLVAQKMGTGYTWFDTGTHESLLEASNFVAAIEKRQGLLIGSPEYCAFKSGFITREELEELAKPLKKSNYGVNLIQQ